MSEIEGDTINRHINLAQLFDFGRGQGIPKRALIC